MNRSDFEDLDKMASSLKGELNEYGELEDDSFEDTVNDVLESEDFIEEEFQGNISNTQDKTIALQDTPTTNSSAPTSTSWSKRSYLAPNETDKEFELFKIYCMYGGGRSLQYISNVSHATTSTLYKLSIKNNWKRRAEDYDRAQLVNKLKQVQTSKHELHIRKLEVYREEQEALGKQLTLNAARISFLANSALARMLDEDKQLDARDLPGMLNVAAKLADVGKNLQSTSLGVDNLLAAIEEAEGE